ncbi:trehalose-phosphatase [Nonomuraea soli]|uniref:Trehalose 6-phosphate phosphatase n=1 Tax=Nonomuraea soli TaxID=1032476 RepID=A0A7W0CQE7_9ACTN|nr:trehalose-phosphatase [Nonomuraea soli]MBA2895220.1 trehalose 6-phosphate phosphatase [Nonomuraea soli]
MTPTPKTEAGKAGLEAILTDPSGTLIGLDFDGTLAPIVEDPAAARAHPAVAGTLARLRARVGDIVIITGRPGQDLVGGLPVLGHYGLEQWADGELHAPPEHPGVEVARKALAAMELPPGVRVEDKGHSVAVHTRQAADPAGALRALDGPLRELAHANGLAAEPGRFVLELRPPGMDKGVALRAYVERTGSRSVLYVGDDLGDLKAFDAVEELRAAGIPGVTVASSSDEVTELAARADLVVAGPDGVVDLLASLCERIASGAA